MEGLTKFYLIVIFIILSLFFSGFFVGYKIGQKQSEITTIKQMNCCILLNQQKK